MTRGWVGSTAVLFVGVWSLAPRVREATCVHDWTARQVVDKNNGALIGEHRFCEKCGARRKRGVT